MKNCSNKVTISWRHLSVKVRQWSRQWKWNEKIILRCCSGQFSSGLNGIMGESGAGKTTLLNVLSGSKTSGHCSGQVEYFHPNASPVSACYIGQHVHESIVSELTVGQIQRYAFQFKNDNILEKTDIEKQIEKTMVSLQLSADLLSRPLHQCSGGEVKRVAIAQEMMALVPPAYLFVDEPSTGLDSFSAFQVMHCLKSLAVNEKITVIAVIHSPNNEILQLFDVLHVLAKGGVTVFDGTPNNIRLTLEKELGVKVANDQPPIEMLLKIACNGLTDDKTIKLANSSFAKQKLAELNIKSKLQVVLWQKNTFLFSNLITHLIRQLRITFVAQIQYQIFSLAFLLLFYTILCTIFDTQMSTASGCYFLVNATRNNTAVECINEKRFREDKLAKENAVFLQYCILIVHIVTMITSTTFYSKYIKMFQSEIRNGWYHVDVFFSSCAVVSLLEVTLKTVFLAIYLYFASCQHAIDDYQFNVIRFTVFLTFFWLVAIYSQAVGHFVGALLADWPTVALIATELTISTLSLLNGMHIQFKRMDNWLMIQLEEVLALAFAVRGFYYSIFGIDRCDPATQYSWVLIDYNIEENRLAEYVWRCLINVVLLKVSTLAVFHWRFSAKSQRSKINQTKVVNLSTLKNSKSCGLKMNNSIEMSDFNSKTYIIDNERKKLMQFTKHKILIAWNNLSLMKSSSLLENIQPNEKNLILNNISGAVRFNNLIAIMGVSGAGKTSLLRVLNGQCKTRLTRETSIYLSKFTPINTCFIAQNVTSNLMHGLTTMQLLKYSSQLRNGGGQQLIDHYSIALRWLNELGLQSAADTAVQYLSGGELKRLQVAIELTALKMPNLVCFDEITSGLDSNSTEMVVRALKRLTTFHPLTIFCTIHQPTSEVLTIFDSVYALAKRGVAIFFGPSESIQQHLGTVPELVHSSPFPIETLIKQSCLSCKDSCITKLLVEITDQQFKITKYNDEIADQTTLAPDGVQSNRPRFMVHSVLTLSRRFASYTVAYLWKEWLFFFVSSLIFATSLRLLFSDQVATENGCLNLEDDHSACSEKTPKQLAKKLMLIDNLYYNYFYAILFQLFILINTSLSFSREYELFKSEHRNGVYSSGSWYLVKSISELVPLFPIILLYMYILDIFEAVTEHIFYWHAVLLLTLSAVSTASVGHIINLLVGSSSLIVQTVVLVAVYLIYNLIGNFIIPVVEMHYFWQLMANFSITRFFFESLMLLQYGFGRCQEGQIQAILYSMSIDETHYLPNIGMLLFNLILFRLVALYLLVRKTNSISNRQNCAKRIVDY